MKIDLLFTAHNRHEFSQASLEALFHNTDWSLVNHLWLVDDDSTDGTRELLTKFAATLPLTLAGRIEGTLIAQKFGGPVAVMNAVLDRSDADVLAKIDNDVIVCPGWLNEMSELIERHPQVDALGMEPGFGAAFDGLNTVSDERTVVPARWIGGVGLIRTRVFAHRRPLPNNRWFGWTRFQERYCKCAWISPDLPVFLLDHLPFEPWVSLTESYIARGWQRRWERYDESMSAYWSWWLQQSVEVAS